MMEAAVRWQMTDDRGTMNGLRARLRQLAGGLALLCLAGTRDARAQQRSELADLPLIEAAAPTQGRTFAIFLSGDGGWAGIDKAVSAALQKRGIGVVGINSPKYFWRSRTPEGTAEDVSRIIREYARAWRADSVVLIGYSRGAGVVPFAANHLDLDVRGRLRLIALLGAEHTAGFKFHVTDLFRGARKDEPPVLPEIRKLASIALVCFYGADERDTVCPELTAPRHVAVRLGGGHHFDGNYAAIGDRIADELRKP
jgi:type IV secretory pathway VirJ component